MAEPYFITFLRHGESVGNALELHQGQADFPLTERGRAQAQALAERWQRQGRRYDLVIASPLRRALETAQIIAQALDLPLVTDPLWKERDNGQLAGQPFAVTRAQREAIFLHLYQPVGETGESLWDLYLRAGQAVQQLMRRPAGRYLVVTHGGLLRMVCFALLGIAPQPNFLGPSILFANTGYADWVYRPTDSRWMLLRLVNPEEEGGDA